MTAANVSDVVSLAAEPAPQICIRLSRADLNICAALSGGNLLPTPAPYQAQLVPDRAKRKLTPSPTMLYAQFKALCSGGVSRARSRVEMTGWVQRVSSEARRKFVEARVRVETSGAR